MGDALFDDDDGGLLPAEWDLPAVLRGRLGHGVGRQRVMHEGGHLLVIVHRVPDPTIDERTGRFAWRDPNGRWRCEDGREGLLGLREAIEDYGTTLSALDERIEGSSTPIDEYFEILEHLSPVTRAARHLHATLQKAREACPSDRALIDLRDLAYGIERRAELMGTDARFALDRALARSSHEHTMASRQGAEAADRLNRLAALFLPIGTAAAVLGMNVQTGLEHLPPPWPLLVILAIGLLIGALLNQRIHRD